MRILLIQPPVARLQHRMSPRSWTEGLGVYPPLGLLYIAAFLERRGHAVDILDLISTPLDGARLGERIRGSAPAIVGVSALTFNLPLALAVARAAKAARPEALTVLGGPHPTLYPAETAALPGVDYAAVGDGEPILAALAEDARPGRDPPGLVHAASPALGDPRSAAQTVDREAAPPPARHLVDGRAYRSIASRRLPMTTVVTGAGCPGACIFCSVDRKRRPYFRSAEHVVEELAACRRDGYREVMFFDDLFTFDRERTARLCELMLARGLDLSWDCRTRVDRVDPELLRLMRRAGCFRVQYGVESGSPEVLRTLRKGFTVDRAEAAIRATREAGIAASASFMIGSPGETAADVERTVAFALRAAPDYAQFTITTPFPFTELYRMGLARGLYREDYWRAFARDPDPAFAPPYWEETLDARRLRRLQRDAFRRFYFRPRYALRQLRSLGSLSEARRKIGLAVRLGAETLRGIRS
jgi:radical SAM superfamily enzyme YgiQ (UPF0313 family)